MVAIIISAIAGLVVGGVGMYMVCKHAKNFKQVATVGAAALAIVGGTGGGLAIFVDNQQVEIKDTKSMSKVAGWSKIALYDGKPLIGQDGTKFIFSVIQKDPWKKPVAYVDSITAPVACPWVFGAIPLKR